VVISPLLNRIEPRRRDPTRRVVIVVFFSDHHQMSVAMYLELIIKLGRNDRAGDRGGRRRRVIHRDAAIDRP
jgi:hypothetical protein